MRLVRVALCLLCALAFNIDVARASIAYGTLNNFDCVNDTGVEAHGFDIELDDVHSTDITYTYDYNHYGVPKITEDNSVPGHPKVLVRYASAKKPGGTWAAFTAVPSGPIAPTQGHQFTNPSVNFGGEHFGVGYTVNPSAVRYNWLIDDGAGNLVHGPPVNVSTPTFTYNPPVAAAPAFVVAVVVPPPPPVLPPKQFGDASWVKQIKTTTHNPNKIQLNQLVGDDPGQPQPWANGEPAEVETEWKLLQTEFANPGNPKGILQGANEELPGGDEVITRRYEFYKYIGPLDAETGEAAADAVGAADPDGVHFFGTGSVTYADHFDVGTGEWVTVTTDLSKIWVVGEFFGAQMAGFDVAPALGLVDHLQDGELNVAYPERTVVVPGGAPFTASVKQPGSSMPDGLTFDGVTGVLSGTPTRAGAFTFTIEASDITDARASKTYTITIPEGAALSSTITTNASPVAGGTTSGGGTYDNGTPVSVIASHSAGYAFVSWTEGGNVVSNGAVYPFTVNGNRTLVANFVPVYTVATSASPSAGGTTGGDGPYNSGTTVMVTASANPGFAFLNWTEGNAVVSGSATYNFTIGASRTLVANFVPARQLTALGAAKVWVGLRNSDDVGTWLDLKADVYLGGTLIGSGQLNAVGGGSSGFNNARLDSIPLTLSGPVDADPGSRLGIKVSARISCSHAGHASGAARVWFNDAQASSRFTATVGGVAQGYYLRSGLTLATSAGTGPKQTSDVTLNGKQACTGPGRPFTTFGSWTITLP